MGVSAGPNISRDGLLVYYDLANTNSFRGESTTNVVADPLPTGSWLVSNYLTSAATLTYESENGVPHMKISSITADTGYPRIYYTSLTSNISTNFSASFEAKGTPGSQIELNIYSNSSTKVILTATLTGNWQRFTFDNRSNLGFALDFPYIRPLTTGATQYIRKIQIEAKAYSTTFSNGTRGTTIATGGGLTSLLSTSNAEILNGASFSQSFNGILNLDGTNDYVRLPSISTTTISVSVWVRSSSWSTQSHPMIVAKGINVEWILWKSDDSSYDEKFGWRSSSGSTIYSTTTAQNNTWYHLLATVGAAGQRLYVNGVLEASNGTTSVPSGSLEICIGAGLSGGNPANFLLGNISSMKIWNRQLTAEEALRDYLTTRTRFFTRETPVTTSLILSLDAGDLTSYIGTGTTWTDISGYESIGALINNPKFSSGNGGSFTFDGIDEYVDIPYNIRFRTNNFTFCVWCNPSSNSESAVISYDTTIRGQSGWGLRLNSVDNSWMFTLGYGSGILKLNGGTLDLNNWQHICGTYDQSSLILYKNGYQVSSTASSINMNSTRTLRIGAINNSTPNLLFGGKIAIFQYYNATLSPSDILRNYNSQRSRFGI